MELQKRLQRLMAERDEYSYNQSEPLDKKTVIALLGASGVGKSTIGGRMQEIASEFGITDIAEVGTEASRQKRSDDPNNYNTGVAREVMLDRVEQGAYVNWSPVINAATGAFDIYATPPVGFAAEYTVMPCLPESLPMLRRAGFKAVHAYYLVTDPVKWEEQLEERKYTDETLHLPIGQRTYRKDFGRRMDEALESIPFGLNATGISCVVSLYGEEEKTKTARKILENSTYDPILDMSLMAGIKPITFRDSGFEGYARGMYQTAFELAREFENAA